MLPDDPSAIHEHLAGKAAKEGKSVGGKGKKAILKGQIKFLNWKGDKFDWDNDDLTENRNDWQRTKVVPAQFYSWNPRYWGLERLWANNRPKIHYKSSYADRSKNARKNAGQKTDYLTHSKTRGVDDDEDDDSIIEIEESDDKSDVGVYPGIKQ